VAAELTPLGHEVIAMDLPCDQEVGFDAYVDAVVDAIGDRRDDIVLVAQSLAGFVAPLVCMRVPVSMMVLVAAMVPAPRESAGDWWINVGHAEAVAAQHLPDDSPETMFTHDVAPDVLAAFAEPRQQTGACLVDPWPLDAWPDVATRFVVFTDDRFFPAPWLRQLVRERLAIEPLEIPGGHTAFFSQPKALAAAIIRCLTEGAIVEPAFAECITPEDAEPISFAEAQRVLADGRFYWFATTHPDGGPHQRPVLGVWLDGAMHTTSNPTARKARNLADEPRCSLAATASSMDIVLEGRATRVTDALAVERISQAYLAKYGWPTTVVDGAFEAPYGAPTAGPPPYEPWRIEPTALYAFGTDDDHAPRSTRWRY
jgi:hypothetical protein